MQCKWHKISGELNFLKPSDGYRGLSLLLYLLDTCHARVMSLSLADAEQRVAPSESVSQC